MAGEVGHSPHGDGSVPTAIRVIHYGVEGLIHPLPEHHSRSLPEGSKTDGLLTSIPPQHSPNIKTLKVPSLLKWDLADGPQTCPHWPCRHTLHKWRLGSEKWKGYARVLPLSFTEDRVKGAERRLLVTQPCSGTQHSGRGHGIRFTYRR